MSSPWLQLPLADYEGHMSAPNVGQAKLLSDVFANALAEFRPDSVAVIGCAGGNGFDRIDPSQVTRVVGIDINPAYLDVAASRHSGRFREFELLCTDIAGPRLEIAPVQLAYAALIFEYVDVNLAARNLAQVCRDGGTLITVLQLPSKEMAAVTPTAFTSLQSLSAVLRHVDPNELRAAAEGSGFAHVRTSRVASATGKEFAVQVFRYVDL